MFTTQRPQLNSITRQVPRRQSQRGQSIVVALLVLLLLGLAGALFVTIVARNIINAGHANRVQTADQYAAAGLTYADSQLSGSVDGADWRPPLQFQLANPPTEARELARYNAAVVANKLPIVNANDPDLEYLQAGYTRYNTGAGRYLVRVTYTPVIVKDTQGQLYDPVTATDANGNRLPVAVPPGKYLKIESIGREGNIDPTDPTTYTNNRSTDRTQSYQVAYKPIGITDYARFETNPDKRSDIANLGVASQFYANTDGSIVTPGVFDFSNTSSTPPALTEYPVLTTYGAIDAYLKTTVKPPTQPVFYPNPAAGSGGTVPTGYSAVPGGGSIHANMTVRFFGTNVIYLNLGADSPLFQDTAEIGGDLLLDTYDPKAKLDNTTVDNSGSTPVGQQASLILNPVDITKLTATPIPYQPATATKPAMPAMNTYITPSNGNQSAGDVNPAFSTQVGLIRDGSMQNDAAGLPRSITRLEPPLVDAQDSASQMPRYRAIAMNSAPRPNLMLNGSAYTPASGVNPSLYGYGKAIYVNNPKDIQQDSASIGGGSTLTDEWLHRTASNSTGTNKGDWNGLFYNPPGVSIVLGQFIPSTSSTGTSTGSYGIRLTRSAGDQFANPDGTTTGKTEMNVPYSDLDTDITGKASDNDIIIYAEGNVRVRGILSPVEPMATGSGTQVIPRHITIVTGGTAYIEGNLLKGSPDSTISVLAQDYVCVNTTQFLAGSNVEDRTDPSQNPDLPDQGNALILDAGHSLLQEFNFGLTGAAKPANYPSPLALYIAAGPAGGGSTTADINIFDPTGASVFPSPQPPPPLTQLFTGSTHLTYDLSTLVTQPTSSNALFQAVGTDLFRLSVSKDPGTENGANTSQDVALERVAVLPMDIRIEAVLYAQTGSFFVIPGDWFNTNQADTLDVYLKSFLVNPNNNPNDGSRPDLNYELTALGIALGSPQYVAMYNALSRFPMYGQPIDLKITIDGSVSEAHPADIAAQTAWMLKWGWIPQYHGSLVVTDTTVTPPPPTNKIVPEQSGHPLLDGAMPPNRANSPSIGLQIIYDPQAGYPYSPSTAAGTASYYLRSDAYGRPLPFTPKLPVSTGLLYSGQSGEAPLLQ